MDFDKDLSKRRISRRTAIKAGVGGALAAQAAMLDGLVWTPQRVAMAATTPSDIQFDIGAFIQPAQLVNGIAFQFPPVFTGFFPAKLNRTPTKTDQSVLANAMSTIEAHYSWSPSGIFSFVAYGVPYFSRLPGGLHGALVSQFMPFLSTDSTRYALEEAVPSPTDVSSANPGITKRLFNVSVVIENNDVMFMFRSDTLNNIQNVLDWLRARTNVLNGASVPPPAFNNLFSFGPPRTMFLQPGLPRKVADSNGLPFAGRVRDTSPMWMSFADQQVNGSGPAAITTFAGNGSAHLTNKVAGNYFDNGSMQHLSHVILDLAAWYALPAEDPPDGEPYTERVQYMFRSNDSSTADGLPNDGFADQFTNGGGPAFLPNRNQGPGDASLNAQGFRTFAGEHRMGHLSALQRSSRAADGTPIHIRNDGPGFDNMDVPNGTRQPKLQFTVFVPTSDFFRRMRINQASLDLVNQFGVPDDDNGLERFITATRRQNFLMPPRRHRSFPLVEFT